jgi:hypothetical protein
MSPTFHLYWWTYSCSLCGSKWAIQVPHIKTETEDSPKRLTKVRLPKYGGLHCLKCGTEMTAVDTDAHEAGIENSLARLGCTLVKILPDGLPRPVSDMLQDP